MAIFADNQRRDRETRRMREVPSLAVLLASGVATVISLTELRRPEPGHMGLANLRDRAAAAGGRLDVITEPGGGTRIIFRLPLLQTDPMPA